MPSGTGGAAALTVGSVFVLVLLTAMTLDVFSGFWDALVENKGPVILVAVGLLIAWLSMREDGAASGAAGPLGRPGAGRRGQLVVSATQPHPSPSWLAPSGNSGSNGVGVSASNREQQGIGAISGAGSKALRWQPEDSASGQGGTLAEAPPRRRQVQGDARNGTVEMVAVSSRNGSDGSSAVSSKQGKGRPEPAPQAPSFPMLRKWHEVAAIDYQATARGRKLWSVLERWRSSGNGNSCGLLAIGMASCAG